MQNVLVWKRYGPKRQGAIIALTTGRYLHKWGGTSCPLVKSCVSGKDITPQGGSRPGPWSRYYQVRVLRAKLSFLQADASLWLQVNPLYEHGPVAPCVVIGWKLGDWIRIQDRF